MQICTTPHADNHASTRPLIFFTGRMPFLPLSQQRQSNQSINVGHSSYCMLLVAVARSSSGGVAVYHMLPVLWITSHFPRVCPMAEWRCNATDAQPLCNRTYNLTPYCVIFVASCPRGHHEGTVFSISCFLVSFHYFFSVPDTL